MKEIQYNLYALEHMIHQIQKYSDKIQEIEYHYRSSITQYSYVEEAIDGRDICQNLVQSYEVCKQLSRKLQQLMIKVMDIENDCTREVTIREPIYIYGIDPQWLEWRGIRQELIANGLEVLSRPLSWFLHGLYGEEYERKLDKSIDLLSQVINAQLDSIMDLHFQEKISESDKHKENKESVEEMSDNYFTNEYFEELDSKVTDYWSRAIQGLSYDSEMFESLKNDVLDHGDDLNRLRDRDKEKFDYFFEIIDSLVSKVGVSKETHYFRNELNKFSGAPENLEDMASLVNNGEWVVMPQGKSMFHMYGENGEYNLKFVSSDGRFEAVYNYNGELLVDDGFMGSVNMGTYNYSTPDNYVMHYILDIQPWTQWRNVRDEILSGESKYDASNKNMTEYYKKFLMKSNIKEG